LVRGLVGQTTAAEGRCGPPACNGEARNSLNVQDATGSITWLSLLLSASIATVRATTSNQTGYSGGNGNAGPPMRTRPRPKSLLVWLLACSGDDHTRHKGLLVNVEPAAIFVHGLHRITPLSVLVVTRRGVRLITDFAVRACRGAGATVGGASGTPKSVFQSGSRHQKEERDLLRPVHRRQRSRRRQLS
jgi:hypothetical protein